MMAALFIIGVSMFVGGSAANNTRVQAKGAPDAVLAALNVALLLNKCVAYVGLCIAILAILFQVFTVAFGG